MIGIVILFALLHVLQFYLYVKVQRVFLLVMTLVIPIIDVSYPGLPTADEEVFNDKEMAELTSPVYLAVFSQAGLAEKVEALARARKSVWSAQRALRRELETKIPRG
jgi:hypothetical protein